MAMAVKLEKRLNPSAAMNVIVPLVSVLAAFVVGDAYGRDMGGSDATDDFCHDKSSK